MVGIYCNPVISLNKLLQIFNFRNLKLCNFRRGFKFIILLSAAGTVNFKKVPMFNYYRFLLFMLHSRSIDWIKLFEMFRISKWPNFMCFIWDIILGYWLSSKKYKRWYCTYIEVFYLPFYYILTIFRHTKFIPSSIS